MAHDRRTGGRSRRTVRNVRRPFWRPVVLPRPAGLACLLSAILLIVLARLLADRAVMSLGLVLAGLFVLSLVLLLLGWLAPLGDDGLPQGPGWRWLVRPRGVRTTERWQRLDQDGRVVADFVGPTPQGRGVWHLVGRRVRWIDPFGLWEAARVVADSKDHVILPGADAVRGAAVASPAPGAIPDNSDTGLIREYADGDALHLVSWSQTARHDELMVRQKDRRSSPRLIVIVDVAEADKETYDRTAALLYGLLRQARRRGWAPVLADGMRVLAGRREQDRYCAALFPPQGPGGQTSSAGPGADAADESQPAGPEPDAAEGPRPAGPGIGATDGPQSVGSEARGYTGAEERAEKAVAAALAHSKPGTGICLVSPVAPAGDSPSARRIIAGLRRAGRTVRSFSPEHAPEHGPGQKSADAGAGAGASGSGSGADAQDGDADGDAAGQDVPALWRTPVVCVLRSVVVPLACLAVFFVLSALSLDRLFSGGLWMGAFATLMAIAVLSAWLPRPSRHDRSALLCVAEICVILIAGVIFVAILAQNYYRSGWVPFFSPDPPRSPAAGVGPAGAARGAGAASGGAGARGGNLVVGAAGSPSLTRLFQTGIDDFSASVLPVQADAGQQAVLIAGAAVLAVIVRLVLIARGAAPFLAVVPLLCLDAEWQVGGRVAAVWQIVLILAAVVLLLWVRHAHRLALPLPALVAVAVVASATGAGPVLSQGSASRLDLGGAGSLFSSSAINPMVDLKRGLTRNSSAVAFTYTSSKPMRFRLATLTDLTGSVWSFDQSLGSQARLYSPRQNGSRTASRGTDGWEQMMTADYPSSTQEAYPRRSPFERTVQGLALLDAADTSAQASSGSSLSASSSGESSQQASQQAQSPWIVTTDAAQRSQEQAERTRLSSELSYSTQVRIADLSTRFLPLAGMPQKISGVSSKWSWSRDRVAYNSDTTTDSRLRYSEKSQYLPAVSSQGQLGDSGRLAEMASLRDAYRQRCSQVLRMVPDPTDMSRQDWADWYRRARSLTRQQLSAWQACVIDFSHSAGSGSSGSGSGGFTFQEWFGSTLRNSLWALDDDPDSSYLTSSQTSSSQRVAGTGALRAGSTGETVLTPAAMQGGDMAAIKSLIGRHYRTLPARLPKAITDVVRQAKADGIRVTGQGADRQIAAMAWLVRYFTDPSFTYSLDAPDGNGRDNLQVVARFLKNRKGYCVHYASALAVLGRALGVPTRIVLGYSPDSAVVTGSGSQKTTYATAQNQLHSWVEAYIDGVGWVPFDVTPGYSDSGARKTSVSADDVARAQQRGERSQDTSASQSGTSGSQGTRSARRQQRSDSDSGRDKTRSDTEASKSGTRTRSRATKGGSDVSGGGRGGMRAVGHRTLVAVGVAAVLLVVLGLLLPVVVRRLRRSRLDRLILRAGRTGSEELSARAWDGAWRQVVRLSKPVGVRAVQTDDITDLAGKIAAAVPSQKHFLDLLVRREQAVLFGGPGARASLRLDPASARRLVADLTAFRDDVGQARKAATSPHGGVGQ